MFVTLFSAAAGQRQQAPTPQGSSTQVGKSPAASLGVFVCLDRNSPAGSDLQRIKALGIPPGECQVDTRSSYGVLAQKGIPGPQLGLTLGLACRGSGVESSPVEEGEHPRAGSAETLREALQLSHCGPGMGARDHQDRRFHATCSQIVPKWHLTKLRCP